MDIPENITPEFIGDSIQDTKYIHDKKDRKYTICIITVENGFKVTGVAHRQFSTEHDEQAAEASAYKKAADKLWAHYSFLSHAVHQGSLSNTSEEEG